MEGKTNFSRRLQVLGTGIAECFEIVDVGCNVKQFDGLTWLTLPDPQILRQIYATAWR